MRVDYPVPRPGIRGWFSQGAFTAVRGASFTLAPGETLGVIGESGSGKTSLALALLDLTPASRGRSRWTAGPGPAWAPGAGARLRRHIQVVFQDPFSSLSPRLTVEQIVGEGLAIHEPGLSRAQRRAAGAGGPGGRGAGRGRLGGSAPGPLSPRVLRRPAPAHRHRPGPDRAARASSCWTSPPAPWT